jgi:hypothetical protein
MKAHIGVDAQSGLVHTLIGTAANVSDVTQAQGLLHGEEAAVFGDAGYQGVEKRAENAEVPVEWHIAMRPGKRRALPDTPLGELQERLEQAKASIRAKVEHPFHVVKNLFRHRKTRYWAWPEYGAVVLVCQSGAGAPLVVGYVRPRCVLKTENRGNPLEKWLVSSQKSRFYSFRSQHRREATRKS